MPDTGSTEHVLEHLQALRDGIGAGIETLVEWQKDNTKYTNTAKTVQLNSIKTIPSNRLHANNCTICAGWDGTASASSSL